MKTYEPKIVRCVFNKKTLDQIKESHTKSTEVLALKEKLRIKGAKKLAQTELQDMIYKAIDNSSYSKDDCFVFCYFGETEWYKRPDDDDLLAKDFIYNFAIGEIPSVSVGVTASTFYYLIKKKYHSQGIAIEKQKTGVYKASYKFLKFLQEINTLNFKN